MFQVIVRAGQPGHIVTLEEPGRITLCHLQKMVERWRQASGLLPLLPDLRDQLGIRSLDLGPSLSGRIGEDGGGLLEPTGGRPDVGPQRLGRPQPALEQPLELGELTREPPFSRSTRSSEEAIACNRSCKRSPAASKGGCPSSVSALRTAKQ